MGSDDRSSWLMALTFDDLPRDRESVGQQDALDIMTRILEVLVDSRLPPCYGFVNGERLESFPDDVQVLREWVAAGQCLGNHTYSHLDLTRVSAEDFVADIERNERVLETVRTRPRQRYFRYPFLAEGDTYDKRCRVRTYLRQNDYAIAHVTADFLDFLWNSAARRCLAERATDRLAALESLYLDTAIERLRLWDHVAREGIGRRIRYVLLLHAGIATALWLGPLLRRLSEEGVQFITLEDALSDRVYEVDPNVVSEKGPNFLKQLLLQKNLRIPPPWPPLPTGEIDRLAGPER